MDIVVQLCTILFQVEDRDFSAGIDQYDLSSI